MDIEALKVAIGILADRRDCGAEYQELLAFTADLSGLKPAVLEQLVKCRLADLCSE